MAAHAVKFDMEFPFVKDLNGECVRATGIERTPGVAVLDADRRLRYRGRIDDRYADLGKERPKATEHDLEDAIKAVLTGKPVEKRTLAVGCYIPQ